MNATPKKIAPSGSPARTGMIAEEDWNGPSQADPGDEGDLAGGVSKG